MTKISSNDDLFQGQSTFIKEMIELKHILKECDENSLVLCDELTSGDTVYVEGYNDAFKVTIYENSQPRYIPIL